MEIEMKYRVPSKQVADEIWTDPEIISLSDSTDDESLVMKAIYFDTENMDLSKSNIAVRVRSEGEHCFATMKCNDTNDNGMFTRDEINIPVTDSASFISLDPKIFETSENGQRMMALIKDKPLLNLLEMSFLRRRKRLSVGNCIMELALDNGSIITDKGEVPIMEMEIELFAGDADEIKKLGQKLAGKYSLTPKTTSKFKDGIDLLSM